MSYEQILYGVEDRIATVALNRPDRGWPILLKSGRRIFLDARHQISAYGHLLRQHRWQTARSGVARSVAR